MLMISKTYKTTHVRLLPVEIFLQIRHELITEGDGSDAGALVGMNPWSSPLQVYLDKKGISEEKETNEAMRLGTDLEDYDYMEDDLHCLDEDYDDDDDEEIMRQYRKDLL